MKYYIPNMWTYLLVTVIIILSQFYFWLKLSLNTITLEISEDIFIPNWFIILCQVYNALCKSSS
jgi:hypothetical protein